MTNRDHDHDKVDEATLALMWLVMWKEKPPLGVRAWKGFDRDTMDRLHTKGCIGAPGSKARAVSVSDEGERAAAAAEA